MTSKHTPGPWSYSPRHICESEPEVRAPEGWLICCTASDDDARLIAAAPDLLDALRALYEMCRRKILAGELVDDPHVMDNACEALAKAEGRQ